MSTGFLFEPPVPESRLRLAASLGRLAAEQVWIGTSSWKYPGWLGQIYTEERYLVRGRFSERVFTDTCLAEYAETFPVVCGDFTFYQFPSEQYWRKLFHSAPPALRFAFKVPEQVTVRVWPSQARYGGRAGEENPSFLDAGLLGQEFLRPLEPYRERVAALILEFGAFPRGFFRDAEAFSAALERFLRALPAGFRYAVEIRNPEFLDPDYFSCLRRCGAAHVFNAWSRMPELGAQIAMPDAFTADFSVTRALLRFGRSYEQAVRKFEPYSQVQEVNQPARDAVRNIIDRARRQRQAAFVFVNNRLEGNAPATIGAIVEDL